MDISLIIPAYNESEIIKYTIESAKKFLQDNFKQFEIIIVDDGSTDQTANTALSGGKINLISYKPNKGKGYAVRQGILAAKGEYIVFTDADMPYSFDYILQAVSNLKDADVVIGSRYIKKDKNSPYPKYRYFLSRGFAYFANSALSLNLTDTQCGFKAFKNQAAKKIFSLAKINDFCFDVEILYIARQMGFKIVELPVTMRRFRTHTKVKTIKDSLKMFRSVLQIKKHGIK